MLTFRDFITGLRKLEIDPSLPVIVHASLDAFGEIHGGVQSVTGALLSSFNTLVTPAFTYRTMIIPEMGPLENALVYGSGKETNKLAEIFDSSMPPDPAMGALAEALFGHSKAFRSTHPILSFTGINARPILEQQTIKEPLLPIQALKEQEGWVLLMGCDHTADVSIHYAEWLAGRKQFVRWALTPTGVVPCPGFPGCPDGFEAISAQLEAVSRQVEVGEAAIRAVQLGDLVDGACAMIKDDPSALLCAREDCERCNTIRASAIEL